MKRLLILFILLLAAPAMAGEPVVATEHSVVGASAVVFPGTSTITLEDQWTQLAWMNPAVLGSGGSAAACETEAQSVSGTTVGSVNPIGSASYNDWAAQSFTASGDGTICKIVLRMDRVQTDQSPEFTGKACIYNTGGYVSNTSWAANTSYSNSIYRRPSTPNNYVYKITSAGSCTSHADTEPSWTTTIGETYIDNTCIWTNAGLNDSPGTEIDCSDEINMITGSTTSEGDVVFSANLSAPISASTKYWVVFTTPTLGDAGDYSRWSVVAASSPSAAYISINGSSWIPGGNERSAKFTLYK